MPFQKRFAYFARFEARCTRSSLRRDVRRQSRADAILVQGIAQAALCETVEKEDGRIVLQDEFERKRESMTLLIGDSLDAAAKLVRQYLDAIRACRGFLAQRHALPVASQSNASLIQGLG